MPEEIISNLKDGTPRVRDEHYRIIYANFITSARTAQDVQLELGILTGNEKGSYLVDMVKVCIAPSLIPHLIENLSTQLDGIVGRVQEEEGAPN